MIVAERVSRPNLRREVDPCSSGMKGFDQERIKRFGHDGNVALKRDAGDIIAAKRKSNYVDVLQFGKRAVGSVVRFLPIRDR